VKVIIDTNGLMIPVQFGVDIFAELRRLGYNEFIIPSPVPEELRILIRRYSGEQKAASKVALSLCERCTVVEKQGLADDAIVELASELGLPVLTNDTGLQNRLKMNNIPVIRLRQKNRLEQSW
jgi:hypothetical protein